MLAAAGTGGVSLQLLLPLTHLVLVGRDDPHVVAVLELRVLGHQLAVEQENKLRLVLIHPRPSGCAQTGRAGTSQCRRGRQLQVRKVVGRCTTSNKQQGALSGREQEVLNTSCLMLRL